MSALNKSAGTADKNKAGLRWISWLFGLAIVIAVVIAALHFSEALELFRIVEQAKPWWILAAVFLQAATYFIQGNIWRLVGKSVGHVLSVAMTYKLSIAKLFVDQSIPSAGIGGTVLVARSLEQAGMPRAAVASGVVVNIASFYIAFVLSLSASLLLAGSRTNPFVLVLCGIFAFVAIAITVALLKISTKRKPVVKLARFRPLQTILKFLRDADIRIVRNPKLRFNACLCQIGIILLDTITMWLLILSLGTTASPIDVFASFMMSSLFRTIGFLPGGLGTFEVTSIVTLKTAGVDLPVALSATLLFRGLSFWLPMLPGFWFSRRLFSRGAPELRRTRREAYWAVDAKALLARLHSNTTGLSSLEATHRLREYGRNEIAEQRQLSRLAVLFRQIRSPLLLLLVFAAIAGMIAREWIDSVIVLSIVLASVAIGYSREYTAQSAAATLRAKIRSYAKVLRDFSPNTVPIERVVPGDVILLSAGSIVPADGVLLEATDFFVSEAVLTGESFPVQKTVGTTAAQARLAERSNCVWMGTNVRSGTGKFVVVNTGAVTEFGSIGKRLSLRPAETDFDRGIKRFGYMLTITMLVIVFLVFIAHVFIGRPLVETLMFSIALAVGLSPELLPAILSVNLARGAKMMADLGVLVRRLNAIENLGSMDVLCTDKTGTLTEGEVHLEGAYDAGGNPSVYVLELGAYNASLQTGLANPLDNAILQAKKFPTDSVQKLAEIPFDFVRKCLSVVIRRTDGVLLITKGAFQQVLEKCTQLKDGTPLSRDHVSELQRLSHQWGEQGIRVIAIASRKLNQNSTYGREAETGLTFAGFLTFLDQPKAGAAEALTSLAKLGVSVKLITGDSRLVAQHVAKLVGMRIERVLTGLNLDELHDEALWHAAERTDLFVEVDPNQKERIILSLKKMGHVVGFLGDGVNDAPAMHAADTSLSVEHAVDVAREAADFVLLKRDLDVIRRGVLEGRKTFANTLKYILTTTSANLGNMLSMAAASLYLPFLPLTAGQILLNNFLSDLPAIGMADDRVDHELVDRPRRWNIKFITRFMVEFGILSSAFDLFTFVVLLHVFQSGVSVFRTGWFIESLLTELAIALVIRTQRPIYRSRPGKLLLSLTVVLIVLALVIPFLPVSIFFGFVPLPLPLFGILVSITILYVVTAELMKRWFYRDV